MSGLWGWIPFIGGVVLVLAIGWAIARNRRTTDSQDARTEAATRELYDRQDAEDKQRDDDIAR